MRSLGSTALGVEFDVRKDGLEVSLEANDEFHDVVVIEAIFELFDLFFQNFLHVRFIVFPLMFPMLEVEKILFEVDLFIKV